MQEQRRRAAQRHKERTGNRMRITDALASKKPFEVETQERVAARRALLDPHDTLAMERVMGRSDLFPISYLERGLNVGRSVCRIEIRDRIGRVLGYGTGFLVSPSLILTNNHVLEEAESARYSLAQFNHETDLNLVPRPVRSFRLMPDRFFITDIDLDFSLVAVEPASADGTRLSDFGYLPLITKTGKILVGEYVSIIQHPEGAPKAVAVRENQLIDVFEGYLHYATDTQPGSSGSPVFSDDWRVVALHHSGVPDPNDSSKFVANEGIRISSIMGFLDSKKADLNAEAGNLLEELFAVSLKPLSPEVRAGPMEVGAMSAEWYEQSSGYDPGFLGDSHPVPLPMLRPELARDVAETADGSGELKYTHFSVVMSIARHLAFFTAVNIDGSQKQDVKRQADKWYFDPRIDQKYQCGPDLYAANELDQGHLVRRLDPVWGKDAKKANEDTFHFTNCSPQHKKLNRGSWEDLEDFILKNAGKYDIKVSVFTGPVFRSDDMVYRGEFRIPAEYWKVVAMVRDDITLSATAYLQTQKNLIMNLEFAYGQYGTYQVPVATVESLTGLDFGELRMHDPLANIESTVGRVIGRPEDIRL
jgi:endonuclease G